MNREILIAALGTLLALAFGYAVLQSSSDPSLTSPPSSPANSPFSSPFSSPSESASESSSGYSFRPAALDGAEHAESTEPSSVQPVAGVESEWAAASANHQAAERALEESEQSLNEVEREIEAVEQFIEDIEERGDDPADFAEEGMAKLRPAIERFEARLEIVEQNERLAAKARARLEAAEDALARQESSAR